MITSIVLENFKCFRKIEVNPRLITVFVGPNGSGKSSVIQALALLKQSVGSDQLNLQGPLVNLRSYEQLQPNFDADKGRLRLGFGGSYELSPSLVPALGKTAHFSYASELERGRLTSSWGSISFTDRDSVRTLKIDEHNDGGDPLDVTIGKPEVTFGFGHYNAIAQLLSLRAVIQGKNDWLSRNFPEVLAAPERILERLRLVPAARGLVQPFYSLGVGRADDISLTGGLSQQEQQTATNLGYSRALEVKLSGWLEKVTEVGLRAEVVPSQSVEVKALTPNGDVNIVAEGFGTNALILLFWQLASAAKGATVMIEEPEIHLHPRAQANLASVMIDAAKAENKQIIMTTHSEHILDRLLTLVAEQQLAIDELAIYAFEKDEKGVCSANWLEVLEDGRKIGGIKDFFDPHLEELNRYVRALQTKK